jgi:hypothetical protein
MPNPKNEPAVITSLLVAAIGDAATLGLIGTSTQDLLVTAITTAVPIIFGLVVRSMVTPNTKVPATAPAASAAAAEPAPMPADAASASSEVPANEAATPEAAPAPVEDDPVKAQLKAAIESVRTNSNALNDARAAAATSAVEQSA